MPVGSPACPQSLQKLVCAVSTLRLGKVPRGGWDPLMGPPPPTRPDERTSAGPVVTTTGTNFLGLGRRRRPRRVAWRFQTGIFSILQDRKIQGSVSPLK